MMRRSLHMMLFAAALLVAARQSLGLVNPTIGTVLAPDWMAQIYVDKDGVLTEFCKGALIRAQWILTSGYCVFDPFDAVDLQPEDPTPTFVVRFAGTEQFHAVEKFVQADDLGAGMMKLAAPVAIQPVALSSMTAAELRGETVFILGQDSTAAVRDSYFNPDFGIRMNCHVDGQVFFRDGAACYILPRLVRRSAFMQATGIVVDPNDPYLPKKPVDTAMPFNTDGSRLYLDFRMHNSYPCHEDVGAPVMRRTADFSLEIVGIVSGVGMTTGMPLCSPSLGNRFTTVAWQQDFIDRTLAQESFDKLCPARPSLNVEYLPDQNVRVWWDAIDGATGYRLMYTTEEGRQPFVTLDMGNNTQVSTRISAEFVYSVALVAYNSVCSSPVSDPLAVAL